MPYGQEKEIYKSVMKQFSQEEFKKAVDIHDINMLRLALTIVIPDGYRAGVMVTPFEAGLSYIDVETRVKIFDLLFEKGNEELAKLAIKQFPGLLGHSSSGVCYFLLALRKGFFQAAEQSMASLTETDYRYLDNLFFVRALQDPTALAETCQILLNNPQPKLLSILNHNAVFKTAFTDAQQRAEFKQVDPAVGTELPDLKDSLRNMLLGKTVASPASAEITVTPIVPKRIVRFASGN